MKKSHKVVWDVQKHSQSHRAAVITNIASARLTKLAAVEGNDMLRLRTWPTNIYYNGSTGNCGNSTEGYVI